MFCFKTNFYQIKTIGKFLDELGLTERTNNGQIKVKEKLTVCTVVQTQAIGGCAKANAP